MRTRFDLDMARPGASRGARPVGRLALRVSAGSLGRVMLTAARATNAADIAVDADSQVSVNPRFWFEMVGTGTASLTLLSDLQTHYKIAKRELGMLPVRGHGALNDAMGIYEGAGSYDGSKYDKCLDAIAAADVRPGMELSFVPTALASSGNSRNPPKDQNTYMALIQAVVQHTVDKFGADDVSPWYWELWNEPNYSGFWTGSMNNYVTMYDSAVAGATAALPNIMIGGPVTTQGSTNEMGQFLDHAKSSGARVSFLSPHAYPGGAGTSADASFGLTDNNARVSVITSHGYTTDPMPSLNTEWNPSYGGQGGNTSGNCVSMDTHVNAPFIIKAVKLLAAQVKGDTPPLAGFSYWVVSDVFDESSGPSNANRRLHGARRRQRSRRGRSEPRRWHDHDRWRSDPDRRWRYRDTGRRDGGWWTERCRRRRDRWRLDSAGRVRHAGFRTQRLRLPDPGGYRLHVRASRVPGSCGSRPVELEAPSESLIDKPSESAYLSMNWPISNGMMSCESS